MSFIEREKTHSVACCEQYKDLSAMHRSRGDCLRDDTTIAGGVFDRQGELAACHSDLPDVNSPDSTTASSVRGRRGHSFRSSIGVERLKPRVTQARYPTPMASQINPTRRVNGDRLVHNQIMSPKPIAGTTK
jgi:hypothetical protein